jgi:Zn-dependent protease/predicted transcriptional regulator
MRPGFDGGQPEGFGEVERVEKRASRAEHLRAVDAPASLGHQDLCLLAGAGSGASMTEQLPTSSTQEEQPCAAVPWWSRSSSGPSPWSLRPDVFGYVWPIGRIGGVEIKVDASWVFIAALIANSFYLRLDQLYPDDLDTGSAVLLAALSALAFFGSVLLHELAHALMARHRGIPVRGITLFLFGGATEAKAEARAPRDEFVITIVGPLTSLALAATLGLVAGLVGDTSDPVPGTIGYLAWLNLVLAIFNLVPGLPLDGGRLLRSALWASTGSLERATRIAARSGQVVGWALIGVGVLNVLAGVLGGLWLAAIGWFLAQAAQVSYAQTIVDRLLSGVLAAELMTRDLVTIPAHLSLQEAIDRYFLHYDHSAFPVTDGGAIVGLLSLRRLRQVDPAERASLRVHHAMARLAGMPIVSDQTPMNEVMQCFEQSPDARVLVRAPGGHVDGIITAHDVARWLRRSEELGLANDRPGF